jgi:hypothetical protein
MEVGGDFYDFIDMGSDKAGLVIGDVTGKSVSGALVMSASRSIFRMLSEEDRTVGEIMIRANRRTKKDIKSGMFVALLYAVMDAQNKVIRSCAVPGKPSQFYFQLIKDGDPGGNQRGYLSLWVFSKRWTTRKPMFQCKPETGGLLHGRYCGGHEPG